MLGGFPIGALPIGVAPSFGPLPDLSTYDHSGAPYGTFAFDAAMLHAPTFPVAGAPEKCLILLPFDTDAATITATTAATPAANLQTIHPSEKWQSDASIAETLKVNLAGPVAVNTLAFVAPNFSGSCYVRVRGFVTLADRDAGTNAVVDTNWQSPWPLGIRPHVPEWVNHICLVRWTNNAALRYWRIDIGEGGLPTHIEIGRIMLCRAVRPTLNIDYDGGEGFAPTDVQISGEYGGIFTERRSNPRTYDAVFGNMTHSDANRYGKELHRRLGMARDLIFIVDPAATADFHLQAIHGVLTAGGNYKPLPQFYDDGQMTWATSLPIKEILF